ncbi:IniB N-terminal domain-containing protein [Actinophytocola oryzae]|uniref:Uncharacterized protein n=1 Tax=Actinophytocola oryzae TaxID=502181 RepID=A0A4R7VQZ6_9PSEU|nr:IniB N-terminal domain-containing protein [Actinophytocola oryzae]TDV52186.1 hypothetical protein CLV71_105317 [Actinophytocola oryzae]
MSFSIDTLQDFVMNIISDEAAKAAYTADPLGALKDAGLGDLTPADVQEVLPLVADSLPAGLPTDLSELPLLGDLPLGDLPVALPVDGLPSLGDLPVDLPTGGLPSLGDLPVTLPTDGLPALGDLPVVGSLPVDLPGVELPNLPNLETPLGDVTSVVIDGVSGVATAGLDTDVLDSAVGGLLSNPAEGGAPTVSTHVESLLGDVAAGAKLAPEEFGGSIAGSSPAADLGAGLVGHVGGDLGAWAATDTVAGDLGAGVLAGPDGVSLAAESPLGNLAANSHGDFSIQPVDTADLLDVDHLGTTGDAVAGTVAHYVSAGAGALAGGIGAGEDLLGGYLTGSLAPVGDTLDSTTSTVTDGIEQGGDLVSEHLTNLPTTDDLPLDQLPELPQLPDLPDIDSGDLPRLGDVTSHLPVSLPDLPDTSAVTDLVSHNPVTDAVHASPVGGLVDGVTSHLPQVGDHLPVDLDLGL